MKIGQNSNIQLKYVVLNGFNDFLGFFSSRMIQINHISMN